MSELSQLVVQSLDILRFEPSFGDLGERTMFILDSLESASVEIALAFGDYVS